MSTTSSSRRKLRTTGWSRLAVALVGTVLVLAPASACRSRSRDPQLTYFDADYGVSLRHPASWKMREARQNGALYRYFVPPGESEKSNVPFSVILVGNKGVTLEAAAERYLAGQTVAGSRSETRGGASGKLWSFSSPDGKMRGRLLLLPRDGDVVGLYARGEATAFGKDEKTLHDMTASFTVERAADYPVRSFRGFDASLGVPESWKQTSQFSGRGTTVVQYTSPPLGVDGRLTIHAALSVTLEAAPAGGVRAYYDATRRKLGENYVVASHEPFQDGFVDLMRVETPVAVSYTRRYYFARGDEACSLSFDAREDVFNRAARWADAIASTFRFGARKAETR